MTGHRCYQGSRLLRIESADAAREQKYRERDEAMRIALMELGGEIVAIGSNVAEQIALMQAKIAELAERLR